MREVKSGSESTEYARTLRAEWAGLGLGAVGALGGLVAAVLSHGPGTALGIACVLGGSYLAAHASSGYAESRGQVKAAAAMPEQAVTVAPNVNVPAPVVNVPQMNVSVTAPGQRRF
jgi:hypothetical protein